MTLDDTDPTFVDDLRESHEAVLRASEWLRGLGYPVIVRPTFIRDDVNDASKFSDSGDLEIIQRIEVKRRRSLTFSGASDFPYDSVIVDTKRTWDNARPKPGAVIIFNKDMTAAIIVRSLSFKTWKTVTKSDRFKNRVRTFYECPISNVEFITF